MSKLYASIKFVYKYITDFTDNIQYGTVKWRSVLYFYTSSRYHPASLIHPMRSFEDDHGLPEVTSSYGCHCRQVVTKLVLYVPAERRYTMCLPVKYVAYIPKMCA
jgi:hypothetical protein